MFKNLTCCTIWNNNRLLDHLGIMQMREDGFPVTKGHTLIIPNRHVTEMKHLTSQEWIDVLLLLQPLMFIHPRFNFGINNGEEAGQTVEHLHFHFIPRQKGDVKDPRGGIRSVVLPPDVDPWLRENSHGT